MILTWDGDHVTANGHRLPVVLFAVLAVLGPVAVAWDWKYGRIWR